MTGGAAFSPPLGSLRTGQCSPSAAGQDAQPPAGWKPALRSESGSESAVLNSEFNGSGQRYGSALVYEWHA